MILDSNHILQEQGPCADPASFALGRVQIVAGNKALPARYAKTVQAAVRALIQRDFTKQDGSSKSERLIAKAIGMSQPQLNAIRNWDETKSRAPNIGVNALIALSEYTGASIDALLGRVALDSRTSEGRGERSVTDSDADIAALTRQQAERFLVAVEDILNARGSSGGRAFESSTVRRRR